MHPLVGSVDYAVSCHKSIAARKGSYGKGKIGKRKVMTVVADQVGKGKVGWFMWLSNSVTRVERDPREWVSPAAFAYGPVTGGPCGPCGVESFG